MLVFEISTTAIDYDLRNLGGRGIIEVDQWFAIDGLPQHRKICPDPFDVPGVISRFGNSLDQLLICSQHLQLSIKVQNESHAPKTRLTGHVKPSSNGDTSSSLFASFVANTNRPCSRR